MTHTHTQIHSLMGLFSVELGCNLKIKMHSCSHTHTHTHIKYVRPKGATPKLRGWLLEGEGRTCHQSSCHFLICSKCFLYFHLHLFYFISLFSTTSSAPFPFTPLKCNAITDFSLYLLISFGLILLSHSLFLFLFSCVVFLNARLIG